MMRRRRLSVLGALILALCFAPRTVAAQDWPTRPVTMIVPFAAGGGTDALARAFAFRLSELLGQQVIVENVGGAAGLAAGVRAAKAAPDGYQFMLGNSATHAYSQTLHKAPPYNAVTDFTPVALVADLPLVLTARSDLPVRTLDEFTAYARANQAKMQFGSAGPGSATHLGCLLVNAAIGVNVTHIPYRGGAPAMQDMLAGRIDYQCLTGGIAFRHIQERQVLGIALLTRKPWPDLPDLRTAEEQGMKGFDASTWNAFFFPKSTPAAIVTKLHHATMASLDTASLQQMLRQNGADVVTPERRSIDYLAKFVPAEIEKWAGPIRAAGLAGD